MAADHEIAQQRIRDALVRKFVDKSNSNQSSLCPAKLMILNRLDGNSIVFIGLVVALSAGKNLAYLLDWAT